MPRAWITQFGRTISGQVVDGLTRRLDGGSGTQVTVEGLSLTGGGEIQEEDPDERTLKLPDWTDPAKLDQESRTMTREELIMGSAFHVSSGEQQPGQPAFTA